MERDPLIGTQLDDYYIQAKLGEGGMAQVYKAYHARLKREVAIKVILPQIADQSGFRERFEREAQLVASLAHRNIVAVYDFRDTGRLTYLVMQYVGGGTLRDLLHREGRIETHKAVQYAIQMARALHHAHQRGIVHRDVKPQNMLISSSDSNEILLSDFGIAKIFDRGNNQETIMSSTSGGNRHDPSVTSVDQMVGTADYMAPEQINRQPIDARTDVYALGIVLFQMLTGQVPFSSTTVQGLLFQQVYTPPRPIRELNPGVPVVVEQIIARTLAKAPEHRYQSAEALALALEAIHAPATHEFSAPMTDNFTTFVHPSQSTAYSAINRTAPTPAPTAQSYYGPMQAVSPGSDMGARAIPGRKKARPWYRLSNIMYGIVCLLAIALLLNKFVLPWTCSTYSLFCLGTVSPPQTNTTFTSDDFSDNHYEWTILNNGPLTTDISNKQYTLNVDNSNNSQSATYFPHPGSVGTTDGPLPHNFTLTVQMEQLTGDPGAAFGIAFRLQGSDSSPSSYAFDMNSQGSYSLEKYVAGHGVGPLKHGTITFIKGMGQFNILQVIVQDNIFSFKINGQVVPIDGPAQTNQNYSDISQPLTGGQLGILVSSQAGQKATFVVKSVALT
jgi:serine/threonine-protein kinase